MRTALECISSRAMTILKLIVKFLNKKKPSRRANTPNSSKSTNQQLLSHPEGRWEVSPGIATPMVTAPTRRRRQAHCAIGCRGRLGGPLDVGAFGKWRSGRRVGWRWEGGGQESTGVGKGCASPRKGEGKGRDMGAPMTVKYFYRRDIVASLRARHCGGGWILTRKKRLTAAKSHIPRALNG